MPKISKARRRARRRGRGNTAKVRYSRAAARIVGVAGLLLNRAARSRRSCLARAHPSTCLTINRWRRLRIVAVCRGLTASKRAAASIVRAGCWAHHRIELSCQVAKASAGEEVVAAVSELTFQHGHQRRSKVEEFGRGWGLSNGCDSTLRGVCLMMAASLSVSQMGTASLRMLC